MPLMDKLQRRLSSADNLGNSPESRRRQPSMAPNDVPDHLKGGEHEHEKRSMFAAFGLHKEDSKEEKKELPGHVKHSFSKMLLAFPKAAMELLVKIFITFPTAAVSFFTSMAASTIGPALTEALRAHPWAAATVLHHLLRWTEPGVKHYLGARVSARPVV
jgi:hypothetical protein